MEVHHHSQPAGKKWTHYLWEFFMLFLAVTLGFLVENQREHYVEKQRAKIYAANLYEDLKKDTATLTDVIEENDFFTHTMDTLCTLLASWDKHKITSGMITFYASYTPAINFFSPENSTIQQLQSSGNLRIMGYDISQKISEYTQRLTALENDYALNRSEFEKMEALYFRIFDVYNRYMIFPYRDSANRDSLSRLNIPLLNDDPKLIREYMGWAKFRGFIYGLENKRFHEPFKKFITELIILLKNKYHFTD